MLKNRIQYLTLLGLISGIFIFTNQYITLILLLFLLILPVFSFILLFLSYKSIAVDFNVPPAIKKSEAVAISFTVENHSFFPVSGVVLNIICSNNLTGKEINTKTFCSIEDKAGCTLFKISDINAGKISVILKKIKVCDILGLFSFSKKVFYEKSGFIYPDTYDVKIDTENRSEIRGEGDRYSQTKKGQDVNEIFALREYTPGDEIRKIHWKISAKQNSLVVRDFGLSLNYPVFLLLEIFNNKTEHSDEALDACLIIFISVSKSLIEKGICHNIAWYDSVSENLVVKQIESAEDVETYLPELLSVHSYNEDAAALKFYEAGGYCNMGSVLYYVATKVNSGELAERALYQTVKTIYVAEENYDNTEDSNITTVTPQNIKANIQDITI